MKSPFSVLMTSLAIIYCTACSGGREPEQITAQTSEVRSIQSNNCEDCELLFVAMPSEIPSTDTSDGWFENGQKLIIKGKVLHLDQKTPASDVIVYYYHTDQKGIYDPGNKTDKGSQRHGRLRGWVKTGIEGDYAIYTSRPAQYPSNTIEAHIHVFIKEPDINEPYYIDAWVFDDDPLLTPSLRQRLENRGGSGILKTKMKDGIQIANQDIILGYYIPGYPGNHPGK